jgi:hypothetical protein
MNKSMFMELTGMGVCFISIMIIFSIPVYQPSKANIVKAILASGLLLSGCALVASSSSADQY